MTGLGPHGIVIDALVRNPSAETTFETDLSRVEELEPILWRLCERLAVRLKKAGLAGSTITLKLKSDAFKLRTRSRSARSPTQLAGRLYKVGRDLLAGECDGTKYRLIGIGCSLRQSAFARG